MAIIASDIKIRLSIKTGTAGNQNAQSNPNASLGKYISTTEWAGGALHDLFDIVTGRENAASTVDYRCIFIHNAHGTLTYENAVVWISSVIAGGADFAIGIDPTATSGISSASAQAVQITNETTAPAGVTFSAPTTEGTGLSLGSLLPGECKAIWIRRTATNSAPKNNDGVDISFAGDTAE
jgi:hypothetical protein